MALLPDHSKNRRVRECARRASVGNTGQKNASVDLGAMPADGFDAAAKKFGTSARPGGSSPRQWMDNTPVVRASEETNQNKPGAIVSVVGVRRDKAALSSGCKPHPATAPAGSNWSSHGGNEVAEAFD